MPSKQNFSIPVNDFRLQYVDKMLIRIVDQYIYYLDVGKLLIS